MTILIQSSSSRYNNLSLIGDCQTLALMLVELCGWQVEFQGLLNAYCRDHQSSFQWSSQYNFEKVEENMNEFVAELQKKVNKAMNNDPTNNENEEEEEEDPVESMLRRIQQVMEEESDDDDDGDGDDDNDDDDDNNDNSNHGLSYRSLIRHRLLRGCILRDDGRSIEVESTDSNYVQNANMYYLMMISRGEINNFMNGNEDDSQLVHIRIGNALLVLNEVNSRCYREMMKWKYQCI